MPKDYTDIITIEPGKRGGRPCTRGMRILMDDILEYLASGMSEAKVWPTFLISRQWRGSISGFRRRPQAPVVKSA